MKINGERRGERSHLLAKVTSCRYWQYGTSRTWQIQKKETAANRSAAVVSKVQCADYFKYFAKNGSISFRRRSLILWLDSQ